MTVSTPLDYLKWLFYDNARVELRHQHNGRWDSAWFDQPHTLSEKVQRCSSVGNLFTSLNRPLAGVTGHLSNDGVHRYTRIFFDFDPVRPTGVAATDAESAEAELRTRDCAKALGALGWPPPAIAMSGSGRHLQYRTALPNTEEFRAALTTIYAELHRRYGDDVVEFDRSVRNPGRICTLYGTVKRKGANTPGRPHRQSWISLPQQWRQILPQQILDLARRWEQQVPPKSVRHQADRVDVKQPVPRGKGDFATLDVVGWFSAHGHYRHPVGGNRHSAWCPWRAEHSTPHGRNGAIVFEADRGWPGFYCHHAHCQGRDIRAVMSLWGDADAYCGREYRREVA